MIKKLALTNRLGHCLSSGFGLVGCAFLVCSCASLKVISQPPGADVILLAANNSQPKIVGKTPYESAVSDLSEFTGGGPIVVQVKQTGYQPQNFLVPTLGGEYVVEANLERNPFASFDELNKIVKMAFLAERQILQKQYDDALKTAEKLQSINDNVAMAFQIKGTVYFIQGKFNESRFALVRALELDPENPEVKNMLTAVETKIKGVK